MRRAAASLSVCFVAVCFSNAVWAQGYTLRFELEGIDCGDEIFGGPGEVVRVTGYAVAETAAAGVRGWSIGFRGAGAEFRLLESEVEGCDAACSSALTGQPVDTNSPTAVDPAFVPSTGPLAGSLQGIGVVDAVLLSPPSGQLPQGSSRILRFVFEVTIQDSDAGSAVRLTFVDGLQAGGLPVSNGLSLGRTTVNAASGLQLGECVFTVNRKAFRRGDANADGKLLVSDAITVLQKKFIDASIPIPCMDAADANDDGELDLIDAVVILHHIFTGRFKISPPGPDRCGKDPTDDFLPECDYDGAKCRAS